MKKGIKGKTEAPCFLSVKDSIPGRDVKIAFQSLDCVSFFPCPFHLLLTSFPLFILVLSNFHFLFPLPLYHLFSLLLFIFSFTLYLYNCPLSSLPPRFFSLNSHRLVFLSFSISPPLDPRLKLYACA